MKKIVTTCLSVILMTAAAATAQSTASYTLQLADGVSSDCGIITNSAASRVILTACTDVKRGNITQQKCNYGTFPINVDGTSLPAALLVPLSSFTQSGNTYSYSWTNLAYNTVAIQVDLTNFASPDIWNGSCTYVPEYGGSHTTFYQQYTTPDGTYTCGCNEGWVTN